MKVARPTINDKRVFMPKDYSDDPEDLSSLMTLQLFLYMCVKREFQKISSLIKKSVGKRGKKKSHSNTHTSSRFY